MQQLEFFDIPSPCVGVCEANTKGYCKGCLRSRQERQIWNQLDNSNKKNVLRLCAMRRQKILAHQRAQQALSTEKDNTMQGDLF